MASSTGSTLFRVLAAPGDDEAWRRFVERYAPMVRKWAVRWHLQSDDAEEVTQEVLWRLVRGLSSYDRTKGPFRPWLWGLAVRVCAEVRKKVCRIGRPLESDALQAQPELYRQAEEEFQRVVDRILDVELMERASELAQLRVEPKTWAMFHAVVLEEAAVKDVARECGLTGSGVYRAVYRVKAMLAEIIRQLEEGEDMEARGP